MARNWALNLANILLAFIVCQNAFADGMSSGGGLSSRSGFVVSGNGTFTSPNQNVGIGSSTPACKLDLGSGNVCVAGVPISSGGGGTGNVGIGTTGRIPVYLNSTTIGSPYVNVMDSNGNVGIGTSTAGKKLTIGSTGQATIDNGGNVNTSGNLIVTGSIAGFGPNSGNTNLIDAGLDQNSLTMVSLSNTNGGASAQDYFRATNGTDFVQMGVNGTGSATSGIFVAGDGILDSTSNLDLTTVAAGKVIKFGINSAEKMRLDANGNVGIGTTTPQGALVVTNGNIGIGTWVPSAAFSIGAKSAGVHVFQVTATGNVNTNGAVTAGFGVAGSTLTATSGEVNAFAGSSNGFTLSNNTNSRITDDGTADRWVFTNSGFKTLALVGGNVGIGTTIPQGGLTVMNGNVGIGTWKPEGKLVVLSGNVGIGSLTPGNALDVNGGARVFGSGNVIITANNLGIGTALPASVLSVQGGAAIGTAAYAGTLGPSNGLIVSGNVGIGSTNPGAALDVVGILRLIGTGAGGFTVQSAGNQACTTTCTAGKALMGFDQGTLGVVLPSIVVPTDATADQCLCGK